MRTRARLSLEPSKIVCYSELFFFTRTTGAKHKSGG